MSSIHVQCAKQQDAKTRAEREQLAEQFKIASQKCRQESLRVCRELDAIEPIGFKPSSKKP